MRLDPQFLCRFPIGYELGKNKVLKAQLFSITKVGRFEEFLSGPPMVAGCAGRFELITFGSNKISAVESIALKKFALVTDSVILSATAKIGYGRTKFVIVGPLTPLQVSA